ncbi:MAG: DUF4838 domain-containing protein [Ruminococcaceae bacterium]|nr:DUF4838 domain-containing protein [Oscillospiraceae bacterium]
MKKAFCTLIALLLLLGTAVFASAADNETKITDAVIVIAEDASITDNYAAQRLKYYLDEITGGDIAIVNDSEKTDVFAISVGATALAEAEFENNTDGSYYIRSEENALLINGVGNHGTINGVYAFLEKYCGCHWYEDEIIVIPENSELTVPADLDVTYTPFFEYTETDTKSSRDAEFAVANGQTGGIYKSLTAEQGGDVKYLGGSSHTLVNRYCKPSVYFEEHPEYFALVDGERRGTQLCLTNEDIKTIVTNEVLALLEEKHDPDASMQIVSVTQADNGEYCECDNCKALDEANGSQAGTMITFVNEIARRVSAAGDYDNVAFDTFAYQYTREAPTNVVPDENVIVRLCSIECCFGHTLDDPDCKENVAFMEDLQEWSEICDRLYIWNYSLNCDESVNIHPNFGVLQRNIQIFYEHNVKGIYEQGVFYIAECDAEFAEMKTYLVAKLMQNPYLDFEAEMLGYMTAVYGPGGTYLKEFVDIMTEHAVTRFSHLQLETSSRRNLHNMTSSVIKQCDALWENAKAAAETDEQLAQINRSELCWRYWKCSNGKREFSKLQHPYLWMHARQELYEDFIEMGVLRMGERVNHELSMDNAFNRYFRHIYTWITLYDEDFLQPLNRLSEKIYSFMEKLYIR